MVELIAASCLSLSSSKLLVIQGSFPNIDEDIPVMTQFLEVLSCSRVWIAVWMIFGSYLAESLVDVIGRCVPSDIESLVEVWDGLVGGKRIIGTFHGL